MAAGKTFMTLTEKIQLCKDYATLWSDFFKTFADGLEQKKIDPNEEKTFNQMVSLLAYKHYKLTEMMGKNLPDPDGILEVLCEAVHLQHLKELSEAQFSKLQVNWHTEFIALNKCLGKLIIDLPVDKRAETRLKQKGADESRKAAKPTPQPQRK
jgi:hypothetical protein